MVFLEECELRVELNIIKSMCYKNTFIERSFITLYSFYIFHF